MHSAVVGSIDRKKKGAVQCVRSFEALKCISRKNA